MQSRRERAIMASIRAHEPHFSRNERHVIEAGAVGAAAAVGARRAHLALRTLRHPATRFTMLLASRRPIIWAGRQPIKMMNWQQSRRAVTLAARKIRRAAVDPHSGFYLLKGKILPDPSPAVLHRAAHPPMRDRIGMAIARNPRTSAALGAAGVAAYAYRRRKKRSH